MAMNTTIRISQETKKRLECLGKKGETYETIIRRLLEVVGPPVKVG